MDLLYASFEPNGKKEYFHVNVPFVAQQTEGRPM